MFGDTLTLTAALRISGFSMLVVFLVLLAISCMIDLNAWAVGRLTGRKANAAAASAPKTEPCKQVSAPAQDGIVSVIAVSAIAAYLGAEDDSLVVRRITRIPDTDTAWVKSGLTDSMR